jgi:hypothetical protein
MLVTIYTDASFKKGRAAGAAWIRSKRGLVKYTTRYPAKEPTHAEGIIIERAIARALEEWDNIEVFFVVTDSLNMCKFLWPFADVSPRRRYQEKNVNTILKLCKDNKAQLRTKHIKGHQNPDKSIQTWLKNWCDKNASVHKHYNKNNNPKRKKEYKPVRNEDGYIENLSKHLDKTDPLLKKNPKPKSNHSFGIT